MSRSKWTFAEVERLAEQSETRLQFRKRHHGAYRWAHRNGHLDAVCEHMRPMFVWTHETVAREAAQYETRTEFMKASSSAYQWWTRNGKPAGVCDHMTLQKRQLSEAQVRADALRYQTRNDFCVGASGSYTWAHANGIIDDVCAHMEWQNKPVTRAEAAQAAREYETRSAFYAGSPRCYGWARRNQALDELCAHMTAPTNRSDRNVVYMLAPKSMPFVRKVGITSVRSGRSRVCAIEKSLKTRCEAVMVQREDAREVERELLSMGCPVDLPAGVAGATEFRRYSDGELVACAEIMEATS